MKYRIYLDARSSYLFSSDAHRQPLQPVHERDVARDLVRGAHREPAQSVVARSTVSKNRRTPAPRLLMIHNPVCYKNKEDRTLVVVGKMTHQVATLLKLRFKLARVAADCVHARTHAHGLDDTAGLRAAPRGVAAVLGGVAAAVRHL